MMSSPASLSLSISSPSPLFLSQQLSLTLLFISIYPSFDLSTLCLSYAHPSFRPTLVEPLSLPPTFSLYPSLNILTVSPPSLRPPPPPRRWYLEHEDSVKVAGLDRPPLPHGRRQLLEEILRHLCEAKQTSPSKHTQRRLLQHSSNSLSRARC